MKMEEWGQLEVELIVVDYFNMLTKELTKVKYNKSQHRRALLPLLNGRSEGAIEFKHQNISAVLVKLGRPYIAGYTPLYNYQKLLEDAVVDHLDDHRLITERTFKEFVENSTFDDNVEMDFDKLEVPMPERKVFEDPGVGYHVKVSKTNYLLLEQQNAKLGVLGEGLVLEYEKWYLRRKGLTNLADEVRWVSRDDGDGSGYDILSRNLDGAYKYIEVKTTRLGRETPIYFTANELKVSQIHARNYYLYRVFDFGRKTKMFKATGSLDTICSPSPISYKGYF